MPHFRTLIRNYVLNKLAAGKTDAGERIFDSKVTPNGTDATLTAFTDDDSFDSVVSNSPYEQQRVVTLSIQAELGVSDGYATALDNLCLQVEALIDYKLGGKLPGLKSCEYQSTKMAYKNDGEYETGICLITYNVFYITDESGLIDPSTLSDLDVIYLSFDMKNHTINNLPGPDGQIDKTDRILINP